MERTGKNDMRQYIKKIIIRVIYYSGLNWLAGKMLRQRIFCIGYHSVWSVQNSTQLLQNLYWNISVNVDDFEQQLLFLKNNGHTFIHFSDLKNPETRKLSKPTIVFFDDGFKDVLVNALPILEKHGITATIFIATGLVERTHMLWTLALRQNLRAKGMSFEEIEQRVWELKKKPMAERNEIIAGVIASNKALPDLRSQNIFLDWDDVRELSRRKVEIGSHTVSHEKLIELADPELVRELVDSKKILEEKIMKPVETISYPYGRHDARVMEFARQAGYALGMSTLVGHNSFEYLQKFPFKIKRMNPEEDNTFLDFMVRLYWRT